MKEGENAENEGGAAEMVTCFVCGTEYDPERPDPKRGWFKNRCPKCGWGGGSATPEDDPRFMVMLALVHRALGASTRTESNYLGKSLRVEASPREFELLEHGEQIRVDDVIWRITSKINGIFWMRCFRPEYEDGRIRLVDPDPPEPEPDPD